MGAAVWVAPAIQSVNMTKAWAQVGSWTSGDPGNLCYSVDIDVNHRGVVSYDTDTVLRCVSPQGAWVGTHMITAVSDGAKGWIVTVGGPGASIVEGYAKARDTASDALCNPGTPIATNAMRFAATTNALGKTVKVRDIELTFCLPTAEPGS